LSRVFQELSRGIVNLNNARKIKEFPFPFPWPQMITALLIIQFWVTPLLAGIGIKSWLLAAAVTFLSTFSSFGIHYIAQELENPYGDDPNDLPLREMQRDMNRSLRRLLEPQALLPPTFALDPDVRVSLNRLTTTAGIVSQCTSRPFYDEGRDSQVWSPIVGRVGSSMSRISFASFGGKNFRSSLPGRLSRAPSRGQIGERSEPVSVDGSQHFSPTVAASKRLPSESSKGEATEDDLQKPRRSNGHAAGDSTPVRRERSDSKRSHQNHQNTEMMRSPRSVGQAVSPVFHERLPSPVPCALPGDRQGDLLVINA